MQLWTGIGYIASAISVLNILWAALLTSTELVAQQLSIQNPVERSMPWVAEVNPAVISFQNAKFAVGMRLPHVGFVQDEAFALRENRLNISSPYILPGGVGAGFDLRYFTAGLYSELSASLLFSREIRHDFSVGFKVGLERRSFNTDDFNLVDLDDPVLAGSLDKNNLNLGFGFFWNPGNLTVGLGLNHLNQANISFGGEANLAREITGAIGYRTNIVTPTLTLHNDGFQQRVGFFLVTNHRAGCLQLGYEGGMPFKMQASLNLSRKDKIIYGIDLPTAETVEVSNGSHQFVYSRILGVAEIGRPELLLSENRLQVIKETVIRGISGDLRPEDLHRIPELTAQLVRPIGRADNILVISAGALSTNETIQEKRRRFEGLAAAISELLLVNPGLNIVIRAENNSREDAYLLRDYLTQKGVVEPGTIRLTGMNSAELPDLTGFKANHFTVTRKRPELSTQKLVVQLQVQGQTRKTRKWEMRIRDITGKIIRRFSDKGKLPASLVWDWADFRGKLVKPGRYALDLKVQSQNGKIKSAKRKLIDVTYVKRAVKLHFKDEQQMQMTEDNRQTSIYNFE